MMKRANVRNLVFGIILLLPALFISGFAIRDALRPRIACNEACERLQIDFVGCDEDGCYCQTTQSERFVHIRTFVETDGENREYVTECADVE